MRKSVYLFTMFLSFLPYAHSTSYFDDVLKSGSPQKIQADTYNKIKEVSSLVNSSSALSSTSPLLTKVNDLKDLVSDDEADTNLDKALNSARSQLSTATTASTKTIETLLNETLGDLASQDFCSLYGCEYVFDKVLSTMKTHFFPAGGPLKSSVQALKTATGPDDVKTNTKYVYDAVRKNPGYSPSYWQYILDNNNTSNLLGVLRDILDSSATNIVQAMNNLGTTFGKNFSNPLTAANDTLTKAKKEVETLLGPASTSFSPPSGSISGTTSNTLDFTAINTLNTPKNALDEVVRILNTQNGAAGGANKKIIIPQGDYDNLAQLLQNAQTI